jgi:hypothetical protein
MPNGREVAYDHGRVIVLINVPGVPDLTCPNGTLAVFEGRNLTGTGACISGPVGAPFLITGYIGLPLGSLHNKRTGRVYLRKNSSGSTGYFCYVPGATANPSYPVDEYQYVYLGTDTSC